MHVNFYPIYYLRLKKDLFEGEFLSNLELTLFGTELKIYIKWWGWDAQYHPFYILNIKKQHLEVLLDFPDTLKSTGGL